MKFARQETEGAKRAREQSYEYLNKKTSEEPWYDAEFHSEDSDLAEVFSFIYNIEIRQSGNRKIL